MSVQAKEAFSQYARLNKELCVFEVMSQSEYEQGWVHKYRENPKFHDAFIMGKKKKLPSNALVLLGCLVGALV